MISDRSNDEIIDDVPWLNFSDNIELDDYLALPTASRS